MHLMKMVRYSALVVVLIISGCCVQRPINLSYARDAVSRYYEHGCFMAELQQVAQRARSIFSRKACAREVVVFDIDETVLSEYVNMKSIGFGYIPKLSHEWVLCSCAPAMEPMLELYRFICAQGYRVIFLTGRQHDEYEATKKNLEEQGFVAFDRLIVRAPEQRDLTAKEYKSAERSKLAAEGYTIVACIGDQWSDLVGPHVGHPVKVPNYIYTIA